MPNLNLKNFAKIDNSDFDIKDITVFAGKPGTGKSYIMKFQYAYTEAISSISSGAYKRLYSLADSDKLKQSLLTILPLLKSKILSLDIKHINELNRHIENNDYILAYETIQNQPHKTKNLDHSVLSILKQVLHELSEKQKKSLLDSEEEKFYFIFRNILESIFGNINQINKNFNYKTPDLILAFVDDKLTIEKLNLLDNINSSIFVETPLILEFEKFLPKERFKVPYHIDSLLAELNKNDFSFTSNETDKFINDFMKSTQNIIKGSISKGAQDFSFKSDNGKTYNIINASSGIKSIGLLQYLVKNKALKKGSTLFWEEPEVHLHPTWQLKMVDLFVELMNAGVKIVFSTHSPYMADYLNALAQRNKFRDRISFNLLSEDNGIVSNAILDDDNWNLLQNELLGSLEDIMWQYL